MRPAQIDRTVLKVRKAYYVKSKVTKIETNEKLLLSYLVEVYHSWPSGNSLYYWSYLHL